MANDALEVKVKVPRFKALGGSKRLEDQLDLGRLLQSTAPGSRCLFLRLCNRLQLCVERSCWLCQHNSCLKTLQSCIHLFDMWTHVLQECPEVDIHLHRLSWIPLCTWGPWDNGLNQEGLGNKSSGTRWQTWARPCSFFCIISISVLLWVFSRFALPCV